MVVTKLDRFARSTQDALNAIYCGAYPGRQRTGQTETQLSGRATQKFGQQQIDLAMKLLEANSYKEVEKITGISKSTLTRNKKKKQMQSGTMQYE